MLLAGTRDVATALYHVAQAITQDVEGQDREADKDTGDDGQRGQEVGA